VRNTPTGNQNPRSAQATLLERLGSPICREFALSRLSSLVGPSVNLGQFDVQ
jgi:hypothetical protein